MALVAIDEAQRIVLVNPAAERMFGWSADGLLGQPLDMLIPPLRRTRHREFVRDFEHSKEADRRMAERLPLSALHADGSEFAISATIARATVQLQQRPKRLLLALIRNLSEAQGPTEAERRLGNLRTLIELSPAATWIVRDHKVLSANRACARLFGVDKEALRDCDLGMLLTAQSVAAVARASHAAAAEPGLVTHADVHVTRPDGVQREIEIAVTSLPGQGELTLHMALVDITARRAEALALARSERELRQLAARGVLAREDERKRVSRELHDDLGQRLTAIRMALSALELQDGEPVTVHALQSRLMPMVDEAISSVRRIASDLRPTMLDDLGLFASLDWQCRNAQRNLGIEVTLDLPPEPPPLSSDAAIALYRIVQESLTNVARHSAATQAQVKARVVGKHLHLCIEDNGHGFLAAAGADVALPSFGLLGMRERALMVGGQITFGNTPEGGARVSASVPLLTNETPT